MGALAMAIESECDHLTGRMRDICMGVSGLPRDTENKYRALPQFGSLGPLPADVPPARSNHKIRGGNVTIPGNPEKQAAKPWDVSQPARGLGDVVAKVTHATGIDRLVKAVTGKKGCGCSKRQAALNAAVPFRE